MSACCANHTCGKSLDLKKETENVLCPLCVDTQVVYCGEQCRIMDWVKHKCDNAFLIKAVANPQDGTVFAPYHFEDTLDEKEYKRLQETLSEEHLFQMENQRYLVQKVSPDLKVSQQLIGADATFKPMDPKLQTVYRRGKEPDARLNTLPYSIRIVGDNGMEVTLSGTIGSDAIYKGHLAWLQNPNKALDWLLGRRKESSSIVLFPRVTQNPEERAFPPSGTLSVTVTVDGKVVTQWDNAPYTMKTRGYEFTRALGKFLTPRLKVLFPGADAARKDMKLLRAQVGSTSLVLVFNVPRMESESMRLEGAIYTVSETNLLRAAFGTGMGAGKPTKVAATRSEPPPPPPYDDETDTSSLPPPPPPPPEVEEEGEFVSPSSVRPGGGGGGIDPTALQQRGSGLRKTPEMPRKDVVGGGGGSMWEEARQKIVSRGKSLQTDGEDNGNDSDWLKAQISRQIIFSPLLGNTNAISMECDANNLAQVTGLAMALEYRTALGDKTLEPLDHVTSLIHEHARALAASPTTTTTTEVSVPVSTAIYTAVDALNQQYY